MTFLVSLSVLAIALFTFITSVYGTVCPGGLDCGSQECCITQDGAQYCCSQKIYVGAPVEGIWTLRDHWGALIGGLIISVIISVILSVLCCLFCNGCLWHRRRNPHLYTAASPCCCLDVPFGTITISSYPPYCEDSPPSSRPASSTSTYSNRPRVHFDQETNIKESEIPRSVLKKL